MKKLVIVAAVFVCLVLLVLGYRTYLIHDARKPVLAKLNDPDSAKFRDERYIGNWQPGDGMLCGELNAKNAMGGYTGYQKFAAAGNSVSLASEFDAEFVTEVCTVQDNPRPWWWLRF